MDSTHLLVKNLPLIRMAVDEWLDMHWHYPHTNYQWLEMREFQRELENMGDLDPDAAVGMQGR